MKKILIIGLIATAALFAKDKDGKCFSDSECSFGQECTSGVCTKKKEFDYGGSGKTGKECNIDADCIGSGKCVKSISGQGRCTGN